MIDPGVELIRRIRGGDEEALADLIAQNSQVLRLHLARYVAPADADEYRNVEGKFEKFFSAKPGASG